MSPGPSGPPGHLHCRASLNLQIQLSIHVSQGITGHAGNQLPRARDPRPADFFPLHSGVGSDFTGNRKSTGKVGDSAPEPRSEILVISLSQLIATGPPTRTFNLVG